MSTIPENKPFERPNQDGANTVLNRSFAVLAKNLWRFIGQVLNIRGEVDYEDSIKGIKKDVLFQGRTVWILICSIFIASIGLNVNSAAVVIGAMLISPLMGPILGIGLAVGTNDLETLKSSLKNFGVAVGVALITSTLYFLLTPLSDVSNELLSRTKPTLLDVFLAIFGGLAGIIAGSRKEKSNVVPGVAIATALMPPLCTAGFGLATGNFAYFFGAFYLFFLNSVFICISTIVMVRYLHYPKIEILNKNTEVKVRRYILLFIVVVIIPSGFIFVEVIKESWFRKRANNFLTENISYEGAEIINQKINYTDSTSVIDLFFIGEQVPDKVITAWRGKLDFYGLKRVKLKVHQAKDESSNIAGKLSERVKSGILEDIYTKNLEQINSRDEKIRVLENEVFRLVRDTIPFTTLKKEVLIQYKGLKKFAFGRTLETDFAGPNDTTMTFFVRWDSLMKVQDQEAREVQMQEWLKVRLGMGKLRILKY